MDYEIPTNLQWIKAAGGVDGRKYVWGDHFDFSWANLINTKEKVQLANIYEYPTDISPYDVMGMAGNVSDYVSNETGDYRVHIKGGSWGAGRTGARIDKNLAYNKYDPYGNVGFRLIRKI